MSNIFAYIVLIIAVILGTAANGFAKGANGFTLLLPSLLTTITIIGCMFALSIVMKTIPVGITYASFAGLCIIATTIVNAEPITNIQIQEWDDVYIITNGDNKTRVDCVPDEDTTQDIVGFCKVISSTYYE